MARYRTGKRYPKKQRSRCGIQDKVRFPSERAANKAMDTLWRAAIRGGFRGEKLPHRTYPCKKCGGWHLTSQVKR